MLALRAPVKLGITCSRVSINLQPIQGYRKPSLTEKPNPRLIDCDYVGPPDKFSNLRPYLRCISKNETNLAKTLRLKSLEVEEWNQQFWSEHNKRYFKERDEFIKVYKLNGGADINEEGMSTFYKDFLCKNKQLHVDYNIEWYKKNFQLLLLSFCVAIEKFIRRI